MSRTRKTSPYWSGTRNIYKGMRVRKERARLREYINRMEKEADVHDWCSNPSCFYCVDYPAGDAGPTYELAYWNWWAIT